MPGVKIAGVITKPGIAAADKLVPELIQWLREHGVEVCCDHQTAVYLGRTDGRPRGEVVAAAELVIVLGGDGTLLSAARAIAGREVEIFAVNLGSLGFLTTIAVDDLYPELERALRKEQRVERRRMLGCEVLRNGSRVSSYEALNDVVITKASIARMIDVEVIVDGHYVCTYKADGLIVSTPTGSTAYSLSAGGPILFPAVAAIGITPICPHTLTNRPVLVPDSSVIQVLNLAAADSAYLTIDGQVGEPLQTGDVVVCRSSAHFVHLIQPPKLLFFDVLREKLKWGE